MNNKKLDCGFQKKKKNTTQERKTRLFCNCQPNLVQLEMITYLCFERVFLVFFYLYCTLVY